METKNILALFAGKAVVCSNFCDFNKAICHRGGNDPCGNISKLKIFLGNPFNDLIPVCVSRELSSIQKMLIVEKGKMWTDGNMIEDDCAL